MKSISPILNIALLVALSAVRSYGYGEYPGEPQHAPETPPQAQQAQHPPPSYDSSVTPDDYSSSTAPTDGSGYGSSSSGYTPTPTPNENMHLTVHNVVGDMLFGDLVTRYRASKKLAELAASGVPVGRYLKLIESKQKSPVIAKAIAELRKEFIDNGLTEKVMALIDLVRKSRGSQRMQALQQLYALAQKESGVADVLKTIKETSSNKEVIKIVDAILQALPFDGGDGSGDVSTLSKPVPPDYGGGGIRGAYSKR